MLNSVKEKSIDKFLRKYAFEIEHASQVRKLSLIIFDKTREILHNFSPDQRDLLEAGALLHDVGQAVSNNEHHKHSYILITREKIEEFTHDEVEIIGNLARYHRGKPPKKYHDCYAKLPDKKAQNIVRKLSSIIRIADGLDKSHKSIVEDIDCLHDSFSQTLYIIIKSEKPDVTFEINAAEEKKDLFESEFGIQVEFKTSIAGK